MTAIPAGRKVNLGCGHRYHPDWMNIDIVSTGPGVIAHNLSKGVPLPVASVEVVYHAAMLEHLRRPDAARLIRECHRVLVPGGTLRVGAPDLEQVCRLYLDKLAAVTTGDTTALADYEWLLLELLDQSVREHSGGEMLAYLRQSPLPNEDFVLTRIGVEGREMLNAIRNEQSNPGHPVNRSIFETLRQKILKLMYGSDAVRALHIGQFRLAGEVHQWAYDRYSLAEMLKSAGFLDPRVVSATESRIPNWTQFNLDTLPDGTVIKPDLFFMEVVKR